MTSFRVLVSSLALGTFFLAGSAQAGCVQPIASVLQSQIDRFKEEPSALLRQYPEGGGAMVRDVRNMVAADPASLVAVTKIVATSTREQKQALGAGLGQAAKVCERVDPKIANQIQQVVATAADLVLAAEFLNVTGSTATAATGAAGAPSGGPSSGPVGTGSPTGGVLLTGSGAQNSSSFPGSVSGSGGVTSTSNKTFQFLSSPSSGFLPVSPYNP